MIKYLKITGLEKDQPGFDIMFSLEYISTFLKKNKADLMFNLFYEIESQNINFLMVIKFKSIKIYGSPMKIQPL